MERCKRCGMIFTADQKKVFGGCWSRKYTERGKKDKIDAQFSLMLWAVVGEDWYDKWEQNLYDHHPELGPRPRRDSVRDEQSPTTDREASAKRRFCPTCGSSHDADARFCAGCGASVQSETSASAAAPRSTSRVQPRATLEFEIEQGSYSGRKTFASLLVGGDGSGVYSCKILGRITYRDGTCEVEELGTFSTYGPEPMEQLSGFNRDQAQKLVNEIRGQLQSHGWVQLGEGRFWYSYRFQTTD